MRCPIPAPPSVWTSGSSICSRATRTSGSRSATRRRPPACRLDARSSTRTLEPAQRHFRIFLDDTLQSVASTVLKDSTVNLEAGKNYTVLLWATRASTGAGSHAPDVSSRRTSLIPGANVALRVINATGARDRRSPVPQRPARCRPRRTWANVGALRGVHLRDRRAEPDSIQRAAGRRRDGALRRRPRAGRHPERHERRRMHRRLDCEAAPGTTVAGSAITAIVFPRR